MRIGIVAWEFPPEIGGMQTYAYEFARELARRSFAVTVFTRRHEEGEVEVPGVRVLPVLVGRRRMDREVLRSVPIDAWHVMNAAFAWLALEANPVVVSVHGNDFLSPYVPVERPALDRVPLLWRYRQGMAAIEDVWGQIMTRRMLRRALPRASRILANSRYTEQTLLDRLPACTGRTSAGMVGVSEAFLNSPATRPVGRNDRLVTVCRLADRRKSVDAVLSALAELKERHAFTYTVIGDGHLRGELERLTMQLGLQERVTFTGFLPLDEVRRHLAESDLFILASSVIPGSHEGFGIAYLEANACGTPVLAARLAGAVEAVKEGVTGMFVDTPSVPSLVDALDSFLSGRAEFRPEACRAFARGFTWRKVVDQAVPWYERRAHTDAAETALTS